MILAVRTDDAMVQIVVLSDSNKKTEKRWEAGRELSSQLISVIEALCIENGASVEALTGCIFFEGPGSYTGLRIGASVVNALGYSYDFPVVASRGDTWLESGLEALKTATHFSPVTPFYGGNVRVTTTKK